MCGQQNRNKKEVYKF